MSLAHILLFFFSSLLDFICLSTDHLLFSTCQVADITCGVDGNLATGLQDWEGEFFPNISYINYEVREFLGQMEFFL